MYKIVFILIFSLLFTSCYSTKEFLKDEVAIKKINTYDRCTTFSYISLSDTIEYGKLFTEYINLDSSCRWNGLALGYFVSLFMETIKADSYRVQHKEEFDNLEVITYMVDDRYFVDVVYEYSVFEDKFIIDYNGIYSTKVIQKYKPNFVNLYLNSPRLNKDYFGSLVKINFFKSYFVKESQNFEN